MEFVEGQKVCFNQSVLHSSEFWHYRDWCKDIGLDPQSVFIFKGKQSYPWDDGSLISPVGDTNKVYYVSSEILIPAITEPFNEEDWL